MANHFEKQFHKTFSNLVSCFNNEFIYAEPIEHLMLSYSACQHNLLFTTQDLKLRHIWVL